MERINLQPTRSLIPPVYYRLSAVREGELAYNYYGLRHPGGIFSIQFSDVLAAFNHLAQIINNFQGVGVPCSDDETESLKTSTRTFLFQLLNYFESAYEVFLCFCDRLDKPQPGRPLYRWFSEHGYGNEINPYFLNVDAILGKYRVFFNALKHSSNRIGIFQFLNPQNSGKALGFYLEGIDEKGAVGPVVSLHTKYEERYTAWSYNLHLRNFYFLIYQTAFEMEAGIQRLCARQNIILAPLTPSLVVTGIETLASTAITTTANRFEGAFNVFFPQEATERMKHVSLDPKEGLLEFTEDIVGSKAIALGQGWQAIMTSKGDGFSRSWNLLYFKPRPQ